MFNHTISAKQIDFIGNLTSKTWLLKRLATHGLQNGRNRKKTNQILLGIPEYRVSRAETQANGVTALEDPRV
jgi:hypothetical protein